MAKRTVELPANELKIGMYVANLDRPWIETPFLFQGFEISTDDELSELKRLCKVVFVEVSEAEPKGPPKKPVAAAAKPTESNGVRHLSMSDARNKPARDPVPLKTELAAAREIHAQAKVAVAGVMDQLRKGRQVSVPQLSIVVDSMVDSVCRNREAITWLARMKTKDDYLYNHSLASSVWALVLGRHLGLDKDLLKALSLGAMMFDVGKTRLKTEFLTHPGKLSDEQMVEARRHVEHGLDILRETKGVDERVISMVATHHERYDGSGYPLGLSGDSIPLLGRIAGIVDCYDAMTSQRAYAKAMSTYDAVRQLKLLSGAWFHPQLVDQFIQAVGVFPTGSLVELNTGEVGVVISQNHYRRLRPELMLILDENKQLKDDFATVDLTVHGDGSDDRPKLWITRGLEPGSFGIDPTEYFL